MEMQPFSNNFRIFIELKTYTYNMRYQNFFTFVLLTALFFSCKKDKAIWNSEWRVPIATDTLNLKNLERDSVVSINPNGSYQFIYKKDILSLRIDSLIQFPDTTISQDEHISVSHIDLNPGVSFINKTEEHTFDLDGAQLKKIIVQQGFVDVKLSSPIQGATIVTIQLPGVTKDGVMYSQTVNVPAGTTANPATVERHFDLQGYSIDLRGNDGTKYNILQSKLTIKTDPNGGVISIDNTDIIHVDVRFYGFNPSYARGYFGHHLFQDTTELRIKKLKNITDGTISTEDINFDIAVYNNLKVLGRAKINSLTGTNIQQQTVPLTFSQLGNWNAINPATGSWSSLQPSVLNWNINDNNSTINSFVENLPSNLKLAYDLELNPSGNVSAGWDEIYPNSNLRVQFKANMPLKIGASNLTYVDTLALEVDQNYDKTHVESGALYLTVHNAYPFSAKLQLIALDEDGEILFQKNSLQEITGSSNLNNYQPLEVVDSKLTVPLSEKETTALNEMKKLVVRLVFNTPQNGQIATIYSNQYIAFQLFSNINLVNKF